MKRFFRNAYRIEMIDKASYQRWVEETGSALSFKQWKEGWVAIREAFFREVADNVAGVDLPLFMGNLSIKILDNEFKCADDFLYTAYRPSKDQPFQRRKFISTDTPRRTKYVWKKHPQFMGLAATFGFEASRTFKQTMKQYVQGNTHKYQKAEKYGYKKSKCADEPPKKSLFDD